MTNRRIPVLAGLGVGLAGVVDVEHGGVGLHARPSLLSIRSQSYSGLLGQLPSPPDGISVLFDPELDV